MTTEANALNADPQRHSGRREIPFLQAGLTMALIQERVDSARRGDNQMVICRLQSGWVVMGDVQPLPGYCLLLADPVVPSINDLAPSDRAIFLTEMTVVGDAILRATGAARINYEMLGNSEPELHAHIVPRFEDEAPDKRQLPPFSAYTWYESPTYSQAAHGALKEAIRQELRQYLGSRHV